MSAAPQVLPTTAAGKFKVALAIVGYIVLVVGLAYLSLGKAINTAQEMGRYQIEETRVFQGEEKAQELEAFMRERTGQDQLPVEGGEAAEPAPAPVQD